MSFSKNPDTYPTFDIEYSKNPTFNNWEINYFNHGSKSNIVASSIFATTDKCVGSNVDKRRKFTMYIDDTNTIHIFRIDGLSTSFIYKLTTIHEKITILETFVNKFQDNVFVYNEKVNLVTETNYAFLPEKLTFIAHGYWLFSSLGIKYFGTLVSDVAYVNSQAIDSKYYTKFIWWLNLNEKNVIVVNNVIRFIHKHQLREINNFTVNQLIALN